MLGLASDSLTLCVTKLGYGWFDLDNDYDDWYYDADDDAAFGTVVPGSTVFDLNGFVGGSVGIVCSLVW